MGQKINPVGFRLSVNRNWGSKWFANTKNFPGMLAEDVKVREYLKKKLSHAAVGKVVIERPSKNARISPQKCRLVADLVRGRPVGDALAVLQYTPKKGARIVRKVLESAIANAEHNHEADIDELKVARIEVDAAPVAKRFHARAKGRGNRIVKRLSHIRITVADRAR